MNINKGTIESTINNFFKKADKIIIPGKIYQGTNRENTNDQDEE